jgi:hypothetical protein
MIPIMMIIEIPLPIPLSVIRSPNHITNMDPAHKISVDEILNHIPAGKAAPACPN